ncbi:hypothetical protein K0U27_06700 [archaeon]|nr:hypothetical protein [archaeon]
MKLNALFILLAISVLSVYASEHLAFGYGGPPEQSSSNNYTVEISSDAESYALGETVVFSGNVNKYDDDRSLRISIFDSGNDLAVTQKTSVDLDGTFSHEVLLNEKFSDGKFKVKAQYGNSKATIQIMSFIVQSSGGGSASGSAGEAIPAWIKSNAGWWADGQIDDGSFVQGMQFLISEGFMRVDVPEQGTAASGSAGEAIPAWIKSNAGWWADGQIDDGSFVQGMQFLISEGFMTISG